ncbi:MAG: hydrogenase maturation protease [bacterium]
MPEYPVRLADIVARRPLIFLGIGSELRGDDAWAKGLMEAVQELNDPQILAFWGSAAPENFLAPIARAHPAQVLLCDAGLIPGPAGSYALALPEEAVEGFAFSHRLPLSFLADQIHQRTGAEVHLLLMRPESLELQENLSPAVETGLQQLLRELRQALQSMTRPTGARLSGDGPPFPR